MTKSDYKNILEQHSEDTKKALRNYKSKADKEVETMLRIETQLDNVADIISSYTTDKQLLDFLKVRKATATILSYNGNNPTTPLLTLEVDDDYYSHLAIYKERKGSGEIKKAYGGNTYVDSDSYEFIDYLNATDKYELCEDFHDKDFNIDKWQDLAEVLIDKTSKENIEQAIAKSLELIVQGKDIKDMIRD